MEIDVDFWPPCPLWTRRVFLFAVLLYQRHVSTNAGLYQALNDWKYTNVCCPGRFHTKKKNHKWKSKLLLFPFISPSCPCPPYCSSPSIPREGLPCLVLSLVTMESHERHQPCQGGLVEFTLSQEAGLSGIGIYLGTTRVVPFRIGEYTFWKKTGVVHL